MVKGPFITLIKLYFKTDHGRIEKREGGITMGSQFIIGKNSYTKFQPLASTLPFLDKQLNEFIENIKNVTDEEKKAMLDNANKFILVAKMYQKMGVDSYAMVQNISTISKLRVLKPINKYDPILKIRVSDEIMTILDNKLIELFTK